MILFEWIKIIFYVEILDDLLEVYFFFNIL